METKTLKCQNLHIVDENGKTRMILGADAKACHIVFCEEDSPYMQILVSKKDDANISILNRDGVVRFGIGMFASGAVGIAINDSRGIPKLTIGYGAGGEKAEIICEGKSVA